MRVVLGTEEYTGLGRVEAAGRLNGKGGEFKSSPCGFLVRIAMGHLDG